MDYQEIIAYLEDLGDKVRDGEADAIEALGHLRLINTAIEGATKYVDAGALEAAEKYPGKTFVHKGVEWLKQDGARRYAYDHIHEIVSIEDELKRAKELAKDAAEFAQKFDVKLREGQVVMGGGVCVTPATFKHTKSMLKMKPLS